MKIDIQAWLSEAVSKISSGVDDSILVSQILLAHGLGRTRTWILGHLDYPLTSDELQVINPLFSRLIAGEPLPYITGHQEFLDLDFFVGSGVLIPRPETELLAEESINWLRSNPGRSKGLDIGTGSGCIAISLAHHVTNLRITAIDISWAALRMATRNRSRYFLSRRVMLLQGNLLDPISGAFDLVVANLPYIPTVKLQSLQVARYEPIGALDGGVDGFSLYRELLADVTRVLAPGGLLLLEIEAGQGEIALTCASKYFPEAEIRLLHDLAGNPRVLRIERV